MKEKTMKKLAIFFVTIGFLSGCATPHVVDEKKMSDKDLSCDSLVQEIAEAKRFEKEARDEKGVTGTNVVAAVFFWPAIVGTYSNANDAIEAAKERQHHLEALHKEKEC